MCSSMQVWGENLGLPRFWTQLTSSPGGKELAEGVGVSPAMWRKCVPLSPGPSCARCQGKSAGLWSLGRGKGCEVTMPWGQVADAGAGKKPR
jgi:hypothetical protein